MFSKEKDTYETEVSLQKKYLDVIFHFFVTWLPEWLYGIFAYCGIIAFVEGRGHFSFAYKLPLFCGVSAPLDKAKGKPRDGGILFGATMKKIYVDRKELHQAGIYEIVNDKGFHKYVGQTMDISKRWRCHAYDLRHNRHGNNYLQNAWNKYGERHFHFEVIEFCKPRDLNAREQYWISKLKPEYNIITDVYVGFASITQEIEPRHNPEYYYDEDHNIKRPIWHKWVYGGQKKLD